MTIFQRVASCATLFFTVAGLVATSAPSRAAELDRTLLPVPAIATMDNSSIAAPVPPSQTPDTKTMIDEASDDLAEGDTVAYPTLDAAVAAQSVSADIGADLRCLAGAIYFESKGEPLAGQLAVAEVILNRAAAGRFGSSVCGVVTQPGQFSFVRGGQVPSIEPTRAAYKVALAVAKVALNDAWDSTAGKALYFHARRVAPRWSRIKIAAIGNHVFYR